MRLLTLLAGYAAGLAVAMKYRKDSGKSKLSTIHEDDSKLNSFIEEVVDIHKTAYADVKWFVKSNFDDVDNFDDLQSKVWQFVSDFGNNLEAHLENAKKTGISKKEEILLLAQDFFETHQSTLEQAKTRAASFVWISEEAIDIWLSEAKDEITNVYQKIQEKLNSDTVSEKPKRTYVRKTATKKTTEEQSE